MKRLLLFGVIAMLCLAANAQRVFFGNNHLHSVGVYYYPEHWDEKEWDRDLKKIADMGFEFTHFAEFAWAQLEPEEGRYDFAWLDRAVAIAAKYKLGVIMCTSTATPPVWLVRKYPEVLSTNEDGTTYDHGSRQHATFSSNFYRQYSLKMVEALAKHYGNDRRIIGWQIDNEPRVFDDFGKDAHIRFRQWLQAKYKTIGALNIAWGNAFWSGDYSSFDQINIPKRKQWGMNLHQVLDHTRFMASETASFLDEQTRTIRRNVEKDQWITSNYIPSIDAGQIGMSHELDFVTYTKYLVSGTAMGVGRKGYRVGDPLSIALSNDFFRPLSSIYGVMELQPGQVNWGRINPQPLPGAVRLWLWHQFAGGSAFVCTYRFRAPIYGYEAHHYGIVGTDGITPTTGGLEYQKFAEEINVLRKNFDPKAKQPTDYLKRRTGLLFNHENIWGMEQNRQTSEWNSFAHIEKYYKTLKSFGAPVDVIRDSVDYSAYPVIVAPAYQQVDKQWVDKLVKYVQNGGNLVLSVRTGSKDREAHLWADKYAAPVYPLIGAEIEFYDLLMPQVPDTVKMDGKPYAWTSWGDILKPYDGTEAWATFHGDFYAGKPAVIHRKLGKGTVTYVGADSRNGLLERDVLTKLYGKLGIAVENYPEGVLVEYRNGFGVAVNYGDKPYEMSLPAKAQVLVGNKTIVTAGVLVWKQ
ncbi:MAG: beta-galactosidase [Breznakibacter sp.]